MCHQSFVQIRHRVRDPYPLARFKSRHFNGRGGNFGTGGSSSSSGSIALSVGSSPLTIWMSCLAWVADVETQSGKVNVAVTPQEQSADETCDDRDLVDQDGVANGGIREAASQQEVEE